MITIRERQGSGACPIGNAAGGGYWAKEHSGHVPPSHHIRIAIIGKGRVILFRKRQNSGACPIGNAAGGGYWAKEHSGGGCAAGNPSHNISIAVVGKGRMTIIRKRQGGRACPVSNAAC